VELLEEARAALARHSPAPLVCNQVLYNLENRQIERSVLPRCRELGITVMAYSPVGKGRPASPGSRGWALLEELGRRYGCTPHQIALAWVIRQAGVVAIPKASRPEHVRQNAAAAELELAARDVARLEAAFPPGPADLEVRYL